MLHLVSWWRKTPAALQSTIYFQSQGGTLVETPTLHSFISWKNKLFYWKESLSVIYDKMFHFQDYHWWWRSFLTSGFTAVYFFIYSIHYYVSKLELQGGASTFLYFGYMLIVVFLFFLLTGKWANNHLPILIRGFQGYKYLFQA